MSLSFYYVATYNVQHPSVKKLLGNLISISDSLMEFKSRSKLFHDPSVMGEAVHSDFDLKMKKMYADGDTHIVQCVTAINPLYNSEELQEADEVFVTSDWEETCTGSIFFVECDDDDEDEEGNFLVQPDSWMVKYELFFAEDAMEMPVNGEAALSFVESTSTYH